MAFRTLIAASKALMLDKKGAKVEGFLTEAKTKVGKFKSTIYTLQTDKGPVTLWGNSRIDSVLLDDKGKALAAAVVNKLVRITCTDERKVKKGKSVKVYRDHKVEVDFEQAWDKNRIAK